MKTIEYKNNTWTDTGDGYETTVGRCKVLTWEFGEIHQVKVFVAYKHGNFNGSVGIGLHFCKTQKQAMDKGVKWAKKYMKTGPNTPDELFAECFKNWKTLYRTRADVMDQIFFTIGGGYTWLDGAIVCTGPEDHLNKIESPREPELDAFFNRPDTKKALKDAGLEDPAERRKNLQVGPIEDDGGPRQFYPVDLAGSFANILNIPDDITDEWLKVTYEAACMLRDRSTYTTKPLLTKEESRKIDEAMRIHLGVPKRTAKEIERDDAKWVQEHKRHAQEQEKNRKIGAKIVAEIKERFGARL